MFNLKHYKQKKIKFNPLLKCTASVVSLSLLLGMYGCGKPPLPASPKDGNNDKVYVTYEKQEGGSKADTNNDISTYFGTDPDTGVKYYTTINKGDLNGLGLGWNIITSRISAGDPDPYAKTSVSTYSLKQDNGNPNAITLLHPYVYPNKVSDDYIDDDITIQGIYNTGNCFYFLAQTAFKPDSQPWTWNGEEILQDIVPFGDDNWVTILKIPMTDINTDSSNELSYGDKSIELSFHINLSSATINDTYEEDIINAQSLDMLIKHADKINLYSTDDAYFSYIDDYGFEIEAEPTKTNTGFFIKDFYTKNLNNTLSARYGDTWINFVGFDELSDDQDLALATFYGSDITEALQPSSFTDYDYKDYVSASPTSPTSSSTSTTPKTIKSPCYLPASSSDSGKLKFNAGSEYVYLEAEVVDEKGNKIARDTIFNDGTFKVPSSEFTDNGTYTIFIIDEKENVKDKFTFKYISDSYSPCSRTGSRRSPHDVIFKTPDSKLTSGYKVKYYSANDPDNYYWARYNSSKDGFDLKNWDNIPKNTNDHLVFEMYNETENPDSVCYAYTHRYIATSPCASRLTQQIIGPKDTAEVIEEEKVAETEENIDEIKVSEESIENETTEVEIKEENAESEKTEEANTAETTEQTDAVITEETPSESEDPAEETSEQAEGENTEDDKLAETGEKSEETKTSEKSTETKATEVEIKEEIVEIAEPERTEETDSTETTDQADSVAKEEIPTDNHSPEIESSEDILDIVITSDISL